MRDLRQHEDLQELLLDLALSIDEATAKASGAFTRDVLYDARDGKWMPRPRTIRAIAAALRVSRDRVTAACEESCRRAGNIDAIQRFRTGRRPARHRPAS